MHLFFMRNFHGLCHILHILCVGGLPEYLESLIVSLPFKIWETTQMLVLLTVSSSSFNGV
jgi:hypothetical protein